MSFRGVLGGLPIPRQPLGFLLPDGVPPGSEIHVLFGELRRLCTRADRPATRHGPFCRNPSSCTSSLTVRPSVADRPRLRREHCRRYLVPRSEPTQFLATPLVTSREDLSDRPSMASSKDSSDVSPSNNIDPTWETLSAEEQLEFEEHQEQLIKEAKCNTLNFGYKISFLFIIQIQVLLFSISL
jgi:hypothetical protein